MSTTRSYPQTGWMHQSASKTVVVFIHGIFSDSARCWWNKRTDTYWPEIVRDDPGCEDPAIFLGGYDAGFGSEKFVVRDAAGHLFRSMIVGTPTPSPLDKDRILFICHSQGGIVGRQLLCTHRAAFVGKKVGFVLCASPSWGSRYAWYFRPLLWILNNMQAVEMTPDHPVLVNLDRDFKELMADPKRPDISGICIPETRGPLWPLPFSRVVWTDSATREFPWQRVPRATHGGVVKPASLESPTHVAMRGFAHESGFFTRSSFRKSVVVLANEMDRAWEAYDQSRPSDTVTKSERAECLRKAARQVLSTADREDRLVGVPVDRLLSDLDGSREWIFDKLNRQQFADLRAQLRTIVETLR